jgi:hypothetical protein
MLLEEISLQIPGSCLFRKLAFCLMDAESNSMVDFIVTLGYFQSLLVSNEVMRQMLTESFELVVWFAIKR